MTTRRTVLRAGLVTVAVGGTALLYRAADQGVFGVARGNAYALWDTWDRTGGIEPVVAAGVLAANAHDSQPWRFRVDTRGGDAVIEVLRDPDRNIGVVDPFRREMHISLGCAVENIAVTARARGHEPAVSLLPGGTADLVARIELGPATGVDPAADPLAQAVGRRHTNRHPYEDAAVPSELLERLEAEVADIDGVGVRWLSGADLQVFRDQTWEATRALTEDAQMSADSHAWQQHSWTGMHEEAAGLTYDGSLSDPFTVAFAKILPDLGEGVANDGFLTATRMHVDTAATAGLLVADPALVQDPTSARKAWLRAGRVWQRLHLAATAEGLVAQPLNQLAELTDRERQLDAEPEFGDVLEDLAGSQGVPMMPFRLGFPTRDATPTPRRPLVRVVEYA